MIKRNQKIINSINMFLDMLVAYGVCIAFFPKHTAGDVFYSLLVWFTLALAGLYNTDRMIGLKKKAGFIFLSSVASTVIYAPIFCFQTFKQDIPFLFATACSVFILLNAKYALTRLLLNEIRRSGRNIKHIAVIGTGSSAERFAEDIRKNRRYGYNIIGFIGRKNDKVLDKHICEPDQLESFLHDTKADEVVIALDQEDLSKLDDILNLCKQNCVRASYVVSDNDISPWRSDTTVIGSSRLIMPKWGRLDNIGMASFKRLCDIIISLVSIVILSPLMIVIAIGVKLSGEGPVFFCQERVGLNRKLFQMLKFRSMVRNDEENTAWTVEDDPRRTAFGSFLRKFSLDELPQLFNVLAGSMSIVGPRPEIPLFVEKYRSDIPDYMMKHQVRPGMTGWAQINGLRGDTSIEERIKYDLWYIDNWSPLLDAVIIIKTIFGGMVNNESIRLKKIGETDHV